MKYIVRITAFFTVLFLALISMSYLFVRSSYVQHARSEADKLNLRIRDDIRYVNGTWDLSRYAADPLTPSPNGSSGFPAPLYVIASDGLVIERNLPISGFLDASDFKHYISLQSPLTLTTFTNETWRVVTLPLGPQESPTGVIVVSYYNPAMANIGKIDEKLQENLSLIHKQIREKGADIDTSQVDIRTVNYDVSFEVITSFNKVLINNGRTPSFIDPSYIEEEIHARPVEKMVRDPKTNELFLVRFATLDDAQGKPIGMVANALSLSAISVILNDYVRNFAAASTLLLLPLALTNFFIVRREFSILARKQPVSPYVPVAIEKVSFDPQRSVLRLNEREIEIPYATNQYYLCKAVFSRPEKRWEQDELLEHFGEEPEKKNARKIYDAMTALNKRAEYKIIIVKEKTYQVNPALLTSLP
jgi:hypothetical protein